MASPWVWLAGGAAAFLVLSAAGESGGSGGFSSSTVAGDVDFPFDDQKRLAAGQKNGGRAHVPAGLSTPAPLLVYLHGNNESGLMHRGFADAVAGASGVVVAAPSQTVNAKGSSLWGGFDLDAFVSAVEAATGVTIDRSRVVVAGHSGAGCSSGAGIFTTYRNVRPRLIVDVDGCMNGVYGSMLGALADKGFAVAAYYQDITWKRDFAGFAKALGSRGVVEQIKGPFKGNPHDEIVKLALERVFGGSTPMV